MPVKNVVLITIDCLRADHTGWGGHSRETTPFMDTLANDGMVFSNAFSNGPATAQAFLSIMTSRFPLEVSSILPPPRDATFLSEILQANGIRTAAISSNPYLSTVFRYDRGWDHFEDFLGSAGGGGTQEAGEKKKSGGAGVLAAKLLPKRLKDWLYCAKLAYGMSRHHENAETVTKATTDWLDKNSGEPFFLWVHYMDAHEPYTDLDIQKRYSKRVSRLKIINMLAKLMRKQPLSNAEQQAMIDIYDDRIRYVDDHVAKIHSTLERLGALDDTVFFILSDHGQQLWEHGGFGHKCYFWEGANHIAWLMHGPDLKGKTEELVQQVHVAPTVLSLFGIDAPPEYRGKDILAADYSEDYIICESPYYNTGFRIDASPDIQVYGIRGKRWKYVYSTDGKKLLFDMREDPGETRDLSQQKKEVAGMFHELLEAHIEKERKARERGLLSSGIGRLKKGGKL